MINFKLNDKVKSFVNLFTYIFNILYFLICCFSCSVLTALSDFSFNILAPVFILFILPILFFALSAVKKDKDFNIKFFFGIEIPILLLSFFRMVFVRELTPFYLLLVLSILFCVILYILDLFKIDLKVEKLKSLTVFVYEIPVIMGIYFALISLFYIIPIIVNILKFLFKIDYINLFHNIAEFFTEFKWSYIAIGFVDLFYLVIILGFLLMLFVVFLAAPITSCIVYLREFFNKYKQNKKLKRCLIFGFLYIFIMALSSFHFSDIDTTKDYQLVKNSKNYEELYSASEKILKKQNIIKNSILDEYLSELRYIADTNSKGISDIYSDIGLNDDLSIAIQSIFDAVTYPFQYHKSFNERTADSTYKELFDEDIQFALKDKISKSVNSTFFTKMEEASLLDVNSKDVKILEKEILIDKTSTENIYKVTITESYRNRTNRNKEVYYEFSLPENAVITRLRLGDNLQYEGTISTKGAARKTYENQIRISVDPALIEKNGLRQYTLRVYPVNPYRGKDFQIQKVSFEYFVKTENGKVALPDVYQVRNAYMSASTKYNVLLDKNAVKISKDDLFVQVKDENSNVEKTILPENKKIAFLLDTSYSNKIDWKNNLDRNIENTNDVDYYFFNKFLSKKMKSLDDVKQLNFSLTRKYDAYCYLEDNYDAVIMLTDSSVYDSSEYIDCKNNSPLYIVHYGKIPPYNKALTNLLYKTNGYIFTDIESVYKKMSDNNELNYLNGTSTEAEAINAAKEIDKILRTQNTDDIKVKEKIHTISKEAGIVSDFSSYIALVNENQKKELEENEKRADKFEADLKTGEDKNLKQQNNIFAVPEPQDWILIFLMILISTLYVFKNKLKWIFQKF